MNTGRRPEHLRVVHDLTKATVSAQQIRQGHVTAIIAAVIAMAAVIVTNGRNLPTTVVVAVAAIVVGRLLRWATADRDGGALGASIAVVAILVTINLVAAAPPVLWTVCVVGGVVAYFSGQPDRPTSPS